MRKSGSAPTVELKPGQLPLLNYSSISARSRCQYLYDLSTRRKINSRSVIRPLDLGSAVHFGVAAAIRYIAKQPQPLRVSALIRAKEKAVLAMKAWMENEISLRGGAGQLTEEEDFELNEIQHSGIEIVHRTMAKLNMQRWKTLMLPVFKNGVRQNKVVPACELGFSIPFSGWGGFHMTLDWVAEDMEAPGTIFIIDYKVRKAFTPMDAEEVNLQMPIYQFGLWKKYKIPATGTIMYQIRSRVPEIPKRNKNGTMSRQQIATDWPTYRAALVEAGLDPNDYMFEMKPKLEAYDFWKEDRVHRSMEDVIRTWDQIVRPVGAAMARDRDNQYPQFRHMSYMTCNGCWAREFCLAELRDEDTDFLLQTRFIDLNDPKPRLILDPKDMINMKLDAQDA